jgi:radical SAM protein with 4Fe4S-binding SPASM domain
MECFKKMKVDSVILSLFGSKKEIHERITRKNGSYHNTLKAIELSKSAGLNTELHFVPLRNNYSDLGNIIVFSKELGINVISILRFVPQGRGQLIRDSLLTRYQNIELRMLIEKGRMDGLKIRTGSPYNFLMINDKPECRAAIDRLIIGPDMKFYPCDAFKHIEGVALTGKSNYSNLREFSLTECWEKSPYLLAIRNYLTTEFPDKCKSCKELERCLSGCLAQKVIENGTLEKAPDPMCMLQN